MATKKAVAPKIHVKVVDEQVEKPVYLCDLPVGTVFTGSINGAVGAFVIVEEFNDNVLWLNKLHLIETEYDQEIVNYRVRHEVKIEVK